MTSAGDIAFDDDGRPVPTCDFDFAAIDGETEPEATRTDEAALRREVVARFMQFVLAGNPSAEQAGRRLHLVAYLLRQSSCHSQKELAETLGITEAAISIRLKSLLEDLATLASDS